MAELILISTTGPLESNQFRHPTALSLDFQLDCSSSLVDCSSVTCYYTERKCLPSLGCTEWACSQMVHRSKTAKSIVLMAGYHRSPMNLSMTGSTGSWDCLLVRKGSYRC